MMLMADLGRVDDIAIERRDAQPLHAGRHELGIVTLFDRVESEPS